jgi:predicted DNA binding CopG/RHH family protein
LVLVFGEKERKNMKTKTNYKKAPKNIAKEIEESKRIDDFLPPPNELVNKEENIRVTINLNKDVVSFFKNKAKENGVPYQTMIKNLLGKYVHHYEDN